MRSNVRWDYGFTRGFDTDLEQRVEFAAYQDWTNLLTGRRLDEIGHIRRTRPVRKCRD